MSYKKAAAPVLVALVAVVVQWLNTGSFSASEELVTAIYGFVSAAVVFNVRNLADDPSRKAILTAALAGVAVVIQFATTGGQVTDTQEFVTAVAGLATAVITYYLKNSGAEINQFGSLSRR